MGRTGYRVINDFVRSDQSIIDGCRMIATSLLGDVMGRMRVMNYAIKPVNEPASSHGWQCFNGPDPSFRQFTCT